MLRKKAPKGSFKAELVEWQTSDSGKVSRIATKSVFAYTAYNEKPKVLCLHISGPDDLGRERDVHVDIKTLLEDLRKNNIIK